MNFTTRTIFPPILPLIEDEFATTMPRASSIFIFISSGYSLSLLCAGNIRSLPRLQEIDSYLPDKGSRLVYFAIPFMRVSSCSIWLLFCWRCHGHVPAAMPTASDPVLR